MSRRGKTMTYQERLICGEKAKSGQADAQIAQELGWSTWAIRKWRRAYQKGGPSGLVSHMGRPSRGALSTFPVDLQVEIETQRRMHPGWGPITLIEELREMSYSHGWQMPSRARVAAFLKTKGAVRKYQRHAGVPQAPLVKAEQVHEEWEMDAQGVQPVDGLGEVSLVNISDIVSRMKVMSYPYAMRTRLAWQDYQLVLRNAFLQYGMPKRISLDHDSAFFDNTSPSPYPSRLHLWLEALGVQVVFIENPPPKEHSVIERLHQTMSAQAITGQTWTSQTALRQGLDQRRQFLNTCYPSRTLHYQAPLEAFPQAVHSGRAYRPEWEEELLDLNRVYALLARGRWYRETNCHGEFWLGMQRYNAGRIAVKTTLEIIFDPASLVFVCCRVGDNNPRCFPAKGLTKTDLMGELAPFAKLPYFQLMLPFSFSEWRLLELAHLSKEARLFETLPGTTL